MSVDQHEIAERYERLADGELLELFRSGELTELAQEVAAAELAHRGIHADTAVPEASVIVPAPAATWSRTGPSTAWLVFWWVYFGVIMVEWVFWGTFLLWSTANTSMTIGPITGASALVDALGTVGFYGYLRSKRLFTEGVWQVVFTVYVGKLVFGAGFFIHSLSRVLEAHTFYPGQPLAQALMPALGLAGIVIAIPLAWALFRYAFCSRAFWRRSMTA